MKKGDKQRQKNVLKRPARRQVRHPIAQFHASSFTEWHIRHAREYPIFECLINRRWQEDGLTNVLIARRQPDGNTVCGNYLVDYYCLGLKNTFCDAEVPLSEYRQKVRDLSFSAFPHGSMECPIDLAHELIYGAIEYAAQFGFKPQRDFRISQYVLEPADRFERHHQLQFGKNGKPLFINGPYDNVRAIINQLERTAGPGNYDYLIIAGPPGEEDMVEGTLLPDDEEN